MYHVAALVNNTAYGVAVANMACLSAHLYPATLVESAFSFMGAVGGLAGIVAPVTAGLLPKKYGGSVMLCYVASYGAIAALILIVPVVVWRELWQPYREIADDSAVTY